MTIFFLIIIIKILIGDLTILFNEPPKPEVSGSVGPRMNVRGPTVI